MATLQAAGTPSKLVAAKQGLGRGLGRPGHQVKPQSMRCNGSSGLQEGGLVVVGAELGGS